MAKKEVKVVVAAKKNQRWVILKNIAKREKQGWKILEKAGPYEDMALMEK